MNRNLEEGKELYDRYAGEKGAYEKMMMEQLEKKMENLGKKVIIKRPKPRPNPKSIVKNHKANEKEFDNLLNKMSALNVSRRVSRRVHRPVHNDQLGEMHRILALERKKERQKRINDLRRKLSSMNLFGSGRKRNVRSGRKRNIRSGRKRH